MTAYEKPSGKHDWIVGYIDEEGVAQTMTIFGQDIIEEALKEARHILGNETAIIMISSVENMLKTYS